MATDPTAIIPKKGWRGGKNGEGKDEGVRRSGNPPVRVGEYESIKEWCHRKSKKTRRGLTIRDYYRG